MLLHDYLLSMDNIKWILKKGGVDNKEACYQQGYPRLFFIRLQRGEINFDLWGPNKSLSSIYSEKNVNIVLLLTLV